MVLVRGAGPLKCTSSAQQLVLAGSLWTRADKWPQNKKKQEKKVSETHLRTPHFEESPACAVRFSKLPRPFFPVSSHVVPGPKALQSRRRGELEGAQPARGRRLVAEVLPCVHIRRALCCLPIGSRTYSSLWREILSSKLCPGSSCVAGAAILPYARWSTQICGWSDAWRHVRAWASTGKRN